MNSLFTFDETQNPAVQVFGQDGIEDGSGEFRSEIFQGTEPTCAIRSQQIILRDFGVDLPQEYLKELALENGWYVDQGGTPVEAIGNILESQGVGVHQQMNATVYDLINELAQGRRVIIGVDSGELWAFRDNDENAQLAEEFEDSINSQGADHALIVAGIEVNPDDPDDVKVILTDPGTGDLRIEYPLDQFMDAWEDSNCFMVATDQPAPYQYDPENNQMVPSNFAVEEFLADNTFTLNDDDFIVPTETVFPMNPEEIAMPEDYAPYYTDDHLNTVPFDFSSLDWDYSTLDMGFQFDFDYWYNSLVTPVLDLGWNDWTNAYNLAYADGSGMFNMNPFMTQVMVVFVPVPVDVDPDHIIPAPIIDPEPEPNPLIDPVPDDDTDDDNELELS